MKNILLIVLTIVLAGAVGVGSYFITKNLDSNESNNGAPLNQNGNNNVTNNEQNSNEVKVVDALDYTDNYYHMFKVKLPMITGNKPNALKLNKAILDEVLPRTYSGPIVYAITEGEQVNKGFITDYNYTIRNNIIMIYVKASVPEGGNAIATSGSGLYRYSYFYDITNDKILTKLGDIAKLMELTDIGGAPNYESLNDNFCSEITIEDGKIKVYYDPSGQRCI